MNHRTLLFAILVLVAACSKDAPAEEPSEEPAGGPKRIEFVLRVVYPSLVQTYPDGYHDTIDVPFDRQDQMVVTGDGISGVLKYDRFYVFPGETAFSGYLDYEGEGDPPADLPLRICRINPSRSHDGKPLAEPVMVQAPDPHDDLGPVIASLKEAVDRFGTLNGTCTFGNPSVKLSLAESFFFIRLVFETPFADRSDIKTFMSNGDRTFGPFNLRVTNRTADMVWIFPEGSVLSGSLLDVQDVARFPVKPTIFAMTEDNIELESGYNYEDVIHLRDLSVESVVAQNPKEVIFQSVPGPTDHTIMCSGNSSKLFLDGIHMENGRNVPTFNANKHVYVWVEGECRIVTKSGGISAFYASSLHLQGNGTLYAQCLGGVHGAGICFGGSSSKTGDLVIDGNVSVVAQGGIGGAGIGTSQISSSNYNLESYNCGNIVIRTTGTVKAVGGEGAPGIGAGRNINRSVCQIRMGKIEISGGQVDADSGVGAAYDIGLEASDISSGVLLDEGVTYDGVHGYTVIATKDGVPIQYRKTKGL